MLVIITEDSDSGFQFWSLVKQLYLKNSGVLVQSARPHNYKELTAQGKSFGAGISNVKFELDLQVTRLSKMQGSHAILLAVDEAEGNEQVRREIDTLYSLVTDYTVRHRNIFIDFVGYSCVEEVFLTFKLLKDYLAMDKQHPEARQKGLTLLNYVRQIYQDPTDWVTSYKDIPPKDIAFLRERHLKMNEHKQDKYMHDASFTEETLAYLILEYLTYGSRQFLLGVGKGVVEPCWYLDCNKPKTLWTWFTSQYKSKPERYRPAPKNACKNCNLCVQMPWQAGMYKFGELLTKSTAFADSLPLLNKFRLQ